MASIDEHLQGEVAAAQGQIGVVLAGGRPDARRGAAFVEVFCRDSGNKCELHEQEKCGGTKSSHAGAPAMLATSRRRVRSSTQPPARKRTPSMMRPKERPSLSMRLEK